jgi:hypothetical protein
MRANILMDGTSSWIWCFWGRSSTWSGRKRWLPARNRDLATLGTVLLAELKVPVYAETDVDFEVPGSVTVAEKK